MDESSAGEPASFHLTDVDPGAIVGLGVGLFLVVFFVYALLRARRRRREEIYGTPDAAPLQEPEPALQPPGPDEPAVEPAGIVDEARARKDEEKARRKAEFAQRQLAGQRAREQKDAERIAEQAAATQRDEAAAKALAEREETEERLNEERRAALLATSGSLTEGLAKTRGGFIKRLTSLLSKPVDDSIIEELEEVLFTADIGVHTAAGLLETIRNSTADPQALQEKVRARITEILSVDGGGGLTLPEDGTRPYVLMVVGVNGVGKTTTIGKIAARFVADGKKVVLAAGDTFRAAAVEQLEVWAERAGAEVVKGAQDADPASVIFDAIQHAKSIDADVVIADTAGRLHTKVPLMEELGKLHRVMGKAREGAPDDVLLVVDATTGQNALQQAKMFEETVHLTAVALTKLDGTAKGGIIIGICDELKLPVRYIGIGEKAGDLRPFEPKAFIDALFG